MIGQKLSNFTDILSDESSDSQPLSLSLSNTTSETQENPVQISYRPPKYTGQRGNFRSVEEIDPKYRQVFTYPYFNLVQSRVIDDALYSNKSIVICAPTGSGKTVVFEMAIVQLLMELEDNNCTGDFKIIYMAPVKALCTERLTEWHSKFTKLGLLCIEVTGDTEVDFPQLQPYRIIITTPEKWDMLTRRWKDHRSLVEVVKLFLIDEVHILNDALRGPVLESVVSRMKTIETSVQTAHRIEQLQAQYQGIEIQCQDSPPRIRFVAVSATVSNPEDVAAWLGTSQQPAAYYKFGDECRPVKLHRVVEGYPCSSGTSIFKFDITLNYKLWPIIQKYHNGKPTLIFCNTRKGVALTAETLSREITVAFNPEQKAKLIALAATIKTKKIQSLILSGVGCHHAGLLYEERTNIEHAFRNRDLPILITTTTLAMGVNLPAHLVIIKNTQQYVNGAYQEYSISMVLQMVGRAGRPQFDTEATAVIMTRLQDKARYQALVGGSEPLESYLHKRLAENLNSEAALGTVGDVAQCVQWVNSTFLSVRAARYPRRYLNLPPAAPADQISKKIEELCVRAMNGLATAGLITMDEVSCIESTEAGRLMSLYYLDLETMKLIMKLEGTESLVHLLRLICESHELSDMHLRVDERRCLNALNRNGAAATIRFPMKGKINTRQMKLNCIIQAVLGCLPIPDPSLNQEAMKIMRTADRVCKCLVSYVTRPKLMSESPKFYSAILNSLILAKCISSHLWENSPYVSRQLKGIGPTYSTLLASAGKINFMLLEESHPRDLERIMNKGPPAGNILRKQVGLLPKYDLTITPVNVMVVRVQLTLMNQMHLMENMDELTAGANHKSYIIVGDSENYVLYYATFKESDLISVYDGCITFEVTRKQTNEHKVVAHCVSSTLVGIDKQCEYVFMDLNPISEINKNITVPEISTIQCPVKQTTITDVFKERKRKIINKNEKMQSKQKKNQDNSVVNSLKIIQKSTAQTIEVDFSKTTEIPSSDNSCITINRVSDDEYKSNENAFSEEIEYDDIVNDEQVRNILSNIENEIKDTVTNNPVELNTLKPPSNQFSYLKKNCPSKYNYKRQSGTYKNIGALRKDKKISTKNNYSFLDLLEKKHLCDDNDVEIENETGFSTTVKTQIEKYLHRTQDKYKIRNSVMDIINSSSEIEMDKTPKDATNIVQDKLLQNREDRIDYIDQVPNIISEKIVHNNVNKLQDIKKHQCHKTNESLILPIQKKVRSSLTVKLTGPINLQATNNTAMTKEVALTEFKKKDSNEIMFKNSNSVNLREDLRINPQYSLTAVLPTFDISQSNKLPITVNKNSEIQANVSNDIQSNFVQNSNNFDNNEGHNYSESDDFNNRRFEEEENIEKIGRYSFGHTKMYNICTKNIFKQQVKIISKLKVNWDVTEIVYKKNEQHYNFSELNLNHKYGDAIRTCSDSHAFPKVNMNDNNYKNVTMTENSAYKRCLTATLDKLKLKPCRQQNEINTLQTSHNELVASVSDNKENISKINTCQINTPPENNNEKHINESNDKKKAVQFNGTVKDILQKYSNTFKRQNNIKMYETKPKCSDANGIIVPEITKTNRKYKISDMDNIQTPLLQYHHFENRDNVKGTTQLDSVSERGTNKEVYQSQQGIQNTNNKHIQDLTESDFTLSVEGDLEEKSIDLHIPNTMLRQLSLVQDSINDDEIITPPPEFCDDNVLTKPKEATVTSLKADYVKNVEPQSDNESNAKLSAIKFNNKDTMIPTVNDIMQKYSDMSKRQNFDIYETKNVSKRRHSDSKDTRQGMFKNNRKYKIRDIDKIQVSLPQSLIVKHPNIISHKVITQLDNLTKKAVHEETCQIQNNTQKDNNEHIQNSLNENDFVLNTDDEIEEEVLEILTPNVILSQLSTDHDYDIDQAMLNPKTLLECLNKEEVYETIAPPPEFCNDNEHSSTSYEDLNDDKLNTENITQNYEDSSQYVSEISENTNSFVGDLTASKEVETLMLSQEDRNHFEFNLDTRSYTVVHKYSTENRSESNKCKSSYLANSRKAKLSHFKFERKRIFKK